MNCRICPRNCGADRSRSPGFCGALELPRIARAALHHWEEPCISGTRGSGAIFFSGCNLRCVFCQNYDISTKLTGKAADADELAKIILDLEAEGAHNINLVSPTPYRDCIIEAVQKARKAGLSIPIVYNTNAYESLESIKKLEDYVDIYLPDFKYVSPAVSKRYSGCEDYAQHAEKAILEMYRQKGRIQLDADGIARSGLIIRHLVLPGAIPETKRVLERLRAILPADVPLSLMGQYVPFYRAKEFPPLDRPLLKREYQRAMDYALDLGFTEILIQSLDAADSAFTPKFDGTMPGKYGET